MKRILFHGTSHIIKEFNESSIAKGGDPNSALGIHFTDDPTYAASYADRSKLLDNNANEATVLVVLYQSEGQEYIHDYEEFYGDHDEGTNTKEHFSELRNDLIEDGIDLIDFEGGEDIITTLLIPERIKIIDRISVQKAIELSKYIQSKNITWDKPNDILKAIEFIKNRKEIKNDNDKQNLFNNLNDKKNKPHVKFKVK